MMMPWLLKNEGYPPSIVVAVLLHALLIYFIFDRELAPEEFIRVQPPAAVIAATIQENPQRLKKIENDRAERQQQQQAEQRRREQQQREQAERQRVERENAQKAEAERQRVADAQQRQRDEAAQKQREEDQRKKQEEARAEQARQERAKQEQAAKEQAAREEAERQAIAEQQAQAQQALTEEQQLVAQYSELMRRLISQQWNRPVNAKNGMFAVLNIRLVPTGEVLSIDIVQSSGDLAYDRSIEQAIKKVGSFPELREVPTDIFNRNFRTVQVGFRPEDLLR